jgi:hypothetical protein
MGYRLGGWIDVVIEVQYVLDLEPDEAVAAFFAGVDAIVNAERLQITVAEQPLGAMLDDQETNSSYVRMSGPPEFVLRGMNELTALCEECFPREN